MCSSPRFVMQRLATPLGETPHATSVLQLLLHHRPLQVSPSVQSASLVHGAHWAADSAGLPAPPVPAPPRPADVVSLPPAPAAVVSGLPPVPPRPAPAVDLPAPPPAASVFMSSSG